MKKIDTFIENYKKPSYEKRIESLHQLRYLIEEHEAMLVKAIEKDLNRSDYETLTAEIYPFYKEINYHIKNLKKNMGQKRVSGAISAIGAKNYIEKIPYGTVAIISPWNYPFLLAFLPMVGAIAAGNQVILKPSEYSVYTTQAIVDIFKGKTDFLLVINGATRETQTIIKSKINYVFFTGSTNVGKLIMKQCSKELIPHTLELGGKSPCLVTQSANLKVAAKRILWGKMLNAGQTCIAPDYVLVHDSIKEEFEKELITQAEHLINNKEKFSNIISQSHFDRLSTLLNSDDYHIIYKQDIEQDLTIGLTIVEASLQSLMMKEEIFGPILPVIPYHKHQEAIDLVHEVCPSPLAMYIFSETKETVERFSFNINSGAVCINDVIMHINNNKLPFGGMGASGIGQYHGQYSFDTFSHSRAVLKNKGNLFMDLRYKLDDQKVKSLKPKKRKQKQIIKEKQASV